MLPDGSLEAVSDLVIAQQLVDAGAPNKASTATTQIMHALFRDWDNRGMSHDQLFQELLPSFTFELESLLQGPMKLWIEYFSNTENQAIYKSLLRTILERGKSVLAANDLGNNVDPLAVEKRLVMMYTGSLIQPRISTLADDLTYKSKLLFQEAFSDLERNGMTADTMLDFLEIREHKNMDLLENSHLWTWISFVIDRHGDISSFQSTDPEIVRIKALFRQDRETMFNHLYKQLTDDELVTLFEEAMGGDLRFYYAFAFNLVNKWKQDNRSSRDVFLLLKLNGRVEDLLMMDNFSLWFQFVTKTSENEVKASLEMRMILEEKYAKEVPGTPVTEQLTFDKLIQEVMNIELMRPRLYQCSSKLWSVKLLNEGVSPEDVSIKIPSAVQFYKNYISTRQDYFGKKQKVSLPADFS